MKGTAIAPIITLNTSNFLKDSFIASLPVNIDTTVNVTDLDGDGRNEIIINVENSAKRDGVYIYKATGDNQFSEVGSHIWSRPGTVAQWLDSIGVGDYDGDKIPELMFNEYNSAVSTAIYEITQGQPTCTPNWSCTDWTTYYNSLQSRSCTDLNNCGTTAGLPAEIQTCTQPNVECSWTSDGVCPSNCVAGSDADCCTQIGYYVLMVSHLSTCSPECYSTKNPSGVILCK